MVSKRNRILELVDFYQSLGIEVNIGKNKARGNKGFFKVVGDKFRIDIAKNQDENLVLSVLLHEFAHYLHYQYDKTLKSLDFIFGTITEELQEELIMLTVDSIPKSSVEPLFLLQNDLKKELTALTQSLNKFSTKPSDLELKISKSPLKYLLKHDRVKLFTGFSFKYYSIDSLVSNKEETIYLRIKSKQRALKRLNARISRLNKYYNSPTELFARAFEYYFLKQDNLKEKAPSVFDSFNNFIQSSKIVNLSKIKEIMM